MHSLKQFLHDQFEQMMRRMMMIIILASIVILARIVMTPHDVRDDQRYSLSSLMIHVVMIRIFGRPDAHVHGFCVACPGFLFKLCWDYVLHSSCGGVRLMLDVWDTAILIQIIGERRKGQRGEWFNCIRLIDHNRNITLHQVETESRKNDMRASINFGNVHNMSRSRNWTLILRMDNFNGGWICQSNLSLNQRK